MLILLSENNCWLFIVTNSDSKKHYFFSKYIKVNSQSDSDPNHIATTKETSQSEWPESHYFDKKKGVMFNKAKAPYLHHFTNEAKTSRTDNGSSK